MRVTRSPDKTSPLQ